ncbi:NB-ARC domain-containing protein [Oscillatoria acuminata PCC 6304]|uniref:NB-ARC domain-containing protein n=1 Tax=Oscillatoria acuminata PCC 6304 TaxID=56110 RepID=K9TQG3_9CYAN|nr:NB-ARC domain-containing protein [Oscillatoria acuminata PCC 6304]
MQVEQNYGMRVTMAGVLRASEEGLRIVNLARRNPGWNKNDRLWCEAAYTSKATLKRFWARRSIRRETFIDICKAVGIDNWEDVVERSDRQEKKPNLSHTTFPLPDKLPPVRNWVGRSQELNTLKSYLLNTDNSPTPTTAISIVGLAGIGKTTLASQLVRELHREATPFVAAAWECLLSPTGVALPCDRILDSLLLSLSNGEVTPAITAHEDCLTKTERLIQLLKNKPCLLLFDRLETVLTAGDARKAGYFAHEYSEYAWFFQQLLETEHQSKIIFISRECVAALPPTLTRELSLNGLDTEAALKLLQSFSLTATDEEFTQLAHRYQGHPKALELIASSIQNDECKGEVSTFFQVQDWLLTQEIESFLDETLSRLSDLALTCLCRISVYEPSEYPLTVMAIASQMPEVALYELKENIMRELKRRQLLCYTPDWLSYQLHPLVREKADRLLKQNPEQVQTAHRQAYQYFISIPLKPESAWTEIEDIKSLVRAHYHAYQGEDWEEAERVMSGLSECLQFGDAQLQDSFQDYRDRVQQNCPNLWHLSKQIPVLPADLQDHDS